MGYTQLVDKTDGKVFVLVPRKDWVRMRDELEDALDALAYKKSMEAYKASGRRSYPADVVDRIIDGDHPVKVMREWRGLTQAQLAEKTGLAKAVISHIETGVRGGGIKTLGKIAQALNVSIDVLNSKKA